jgi:hypothetical protein
MSSFESLMHRICVLKFEIISKKKKLPVPVLDIKIYWLQYVYKVEKYLMYVYTRVAQVTGL